MKPILLSRGSVTMLKVGGVVLVPVILLLLTVIRVFRILVFLQ